VGFLDKAKDKAGQLVDPIREKVDDRKDRRKADDLLDDLGRVAYRQRTDRSRPDDEAEISRLIVELQALEAEGTDVLATKHGDGAGGGGD
jgi:hypothetical protein